MTSWADRPGAPIRALLAAGTANYEWTGFEDLDKVHDSLQAVVEALTGLGFVTVAGDGGYSVDLSSGSLRAAVREAGRAAPVVVLYYIGHGVHPERDTYYLVSRTSRPADLTESALRASDLPRLLIRRGEDGEVEPDQPEVLLILDCCYSGAAGVDLTHDALQGIGNPNTWLIASASPLEYAQQGKFARAFCDALRRPTTGPSAEFVSPHVIVDAVNASLAGTAEQQARVFSPPAAVIPPFFPNPDHQPGLAGRTVNEQHWLSRLQGAPAAVGFYLTGQTGRLRAAGKLATWMADPYRVGLAVVTGSPGTGKSTLLALPVFLARQARREDLLRASRPGSIVQRTAALVPADLAIVAVHARGLNTDQAAREIARGIGRSASTASQLIEELENTPERGRRVVVVDAVDEAVSPATLLGLLLPLARQPGLAIAVGTRRHVLRDISEVELTIDLDAELYQDPQALTDYVHRLLIAAEEPGISTPYQQHDRQEVTQAVAAAIAQRATSSDGRVESFLIARLLAFSVRGRDEPVDTRSADWQTELPISLTDAFDQDLARLGTEAPLAWALLGTLAWARGPGLPWENVWLRVARALAGSGVYSRQLDRIDDEDIRRLLDRAGAYVVEDIGPGRRSVYRPFHDVLAEHLRRQPGIGQTETDPAATPAWLRRRVEAEGAITQALLGTVSVDPQRAPRWSSAHPYLRTYLAEHAAAAGPKVFSDLVRDVGFRAVADPVTLSPLLSTTAPELRDVARIYRRARPLLGDDVSANAAYLEEAARASAGTPAAAVTGDVRALYSTSLASSVQDDSLLTLTGHTQWVHSVAVGTEPQGRLLLASGSADGTVRLWDPRTGTLAGQASSGATGVMESVAFGRLATGHLVLASGSWDGTVRLWDPATGSPIGEPLTGHTGSVFAVSLGTGADGRVLLASGSSDGTVRLWDPATGTAIGEPLTGHTGSVFTVALGTGADGRLRLASGSSDGTVRLWDPATGTAIGEPLRGHTGAVRSVAFGTGADGRLRLASGSSDGTVRLWDPATGGAIGEPLTGHSGAVSSVAFASGPDEPLLLASGSWDRTLRLWDPATGSQIGEPLAGHTLAVVSVAFGIGPDGQLLLASCSWDQTVRLWDPVAAAPLTQPPSGHAGEVGSVAFGSGPDGRLLLASGSDDWTVRLWDPVAGTPVGEPLIGHSGEVGSVAFGSGPDGLLLASSSWDRTVRLWDPLTGSPTGRPLIGHRSMAVYSVAFATGPDGRLLLASGSDDQTIRLWDPVAGTPIGEPLTGHAGPVFTVAFPPGIQGASLLASGSGDQTIRLWDPVAGTAIGEPLTGHTGPVRAMAFATRADGRLLLASGSSDGTVQLWDPIARTPVGQPLTGHTGPVRAVAFVTVANGRLLLASGGEDRTIRFWEPADLNCLVTIRRRSGIRSIASATGSLAIGDEEGVSVVQLDWSLIQ